MIITKLRVHIAPVGFEVDRIVLPAIEMKVDKIWLLIHNNQEDGRVKSYEVEIVKKFKKAKIEVKLLRTNRKDIFKILHAVKQIIKSEEENDIYINVSSGSKIQAIACMMACMMFNDGKNLTPYYAEPQSYPVYKEKQQSVGLKSIMKLPKYQIQVPRQELVRALKIIQNNESRITKKEMARLAEAENPNTAKHLSLIHISEPTRPY